MVDRLELELFVRRSFLRRRIIPARVHHDGNQAKERQVEERFHDEAFAFHWLAPSTGR